MLLFAACLVSAAGQDLFLSYSDADRSPTQETAIPTDTMQRVVLTGSKCIDGSPATFYIAANTSNTRFVVWLEGGGLCHSLEDCKSRAKGPLGSSTSYPAERNATEGMLLSSPLLNPEFSTWNRIFLPYCSGDSYEGQMTKASNPWNSSDPWRGYFSGHNIVAEVFTNLRKSHRASDATDVILTGCSAGGIGTFLHCDFVAGLFPHARSACRPEAGYFGLPIATMDDWSHQRNSDDMHHSSYRVWISKIHRYAVEQDAVAACNRHTNGGKDIPFCDATNNPDGCCVRVPYYYPFSKTPMFISQNTVDAYQIGVQGGANRSDLDYIAYAQGIIAGSLSKSLRRGDGMFATACYQHCMPWTGTTIDNENNMQAFGDWYFGRSPGHNVHLDNSSTPQC